MAEYSTSVDQVVNPGAYIIFDQTPVPCERGFVRHREGSSNFLLSGWLPSSRRRRCPCKGPRSAQYFVKFGGNIAVNTGGTAGEISIALTLDGSPLNDSSMIVTPAAVEEYFNVGTDIPVEIWNGCCETIAVQNTSDQAILVRAGANIGFARPDLSVTY